MCNTAGSASVRWHRWLRGIKNSTTFCFCPSCVFPKRSDNLAPQRPSSLPIICGGKPPVAGKLSIVKNISPGREISAESRSNFVFQEVPCQPWFVATATKLSSCLALRPCTDELVPPSRHRCGLKHRRSRLTAPPQPVISYPSWMTCFIFYANRSARSAHRQSRCCCRCRCCRRLSQSFRALAAPRAWSQILGGHRYSRNRLAGVVLRPVWFSLKHARNRRWLFISKPTAHTIQVFSNLMRVRSSRGKGDWDSKKVVVVVGLAWGEVWLY